jgi:hypothetical protein
MDSPCPSPPISRGREEHGDHGARELGEPLRVASQFSMTLRYFRAPTIPHGGCAVWGVCCDGVHGAILEVFITDTRQQVLAAYERAEP